MAEKENRPEDRCNQSCANATRIHREVIVQDVQKNRRQYRGRESHKTPGEKQHASDELDEERHADEVRDRNRGHELHCDRV